MALEKVAVPITLVKGVDTKSDDKQQLPGSLTLLENGRFTSPGKIVKRPGYDALSQSILGSSETISSGTGLTSFMDEILVSTGTELYSYSEANQASKDKGALFNVSIDASSVVRNTYQQTSQDSCLHPSGLQCFVWEDSSGGSRYSLIDYETKLQIVTDKIITSDATKPKAFAVGNYVIILYHDTSESNIDAIAIPVVNPLTSVTLDIATNPQNNVYDAILIGSRVYFAYNNNSGNVAVRYIDALLNVSSAVTLSSVVAASITIFSDESSNVWVSLWDSTDVKYAVWDYNLTSVLAITTAETVANVKNITGSVVGSTAALYYDITNGTAYNYLIRQVSATIGGTVGTPSVFIRSISLASKAFVYDGVRYVLGSYASSYQPTYFLLNGSANVAAKLAALQGGGLSAKNVIPQVNQVSTGMYQITYLQKNTVDAVNGLIVSQSNVMQATLDFTSVGLISSELAGDLHIGGGFLAMYDSANLVEHGFHLFPEQVSVTDTGGGGSIADGTYQYSAIYSWTDNSGNIHRSAPSIAQTITTSGGNSTVAVVVPTLRVTAKTNVVVEIYRTAASGQVFYRVTSITSPTFNTTSADTVTYNDTAADASIIGNNQLYTTGGVVENISVPATKIFTNYKTRIIAVPAENKNQWWYSKEVVPGLPVEFSDSFVNNMDQLGGDITAVGVLDDKIVFFKPNVKFYVYGDGPAANGTNGTFSPPGTITSDTGCTNQRSIVSTPSGLMYQSPKGIYLLDRSLVDNFIGAPVEAYTQDSLVTSAVLMTDTNQVRFTMNSGVTLVYDYYIKQWSIDTGLDASDSTVWQGTRYAVLQSSGRVLVENGAVFTDAGQFVRLKMRLAWISLAQIQGFQRVRQLLILGTYKSYHRLIVTIAENFNTSPYQYTYINAYLLEPNTYGSDATYGASVVYGGNYPDYNFRVYLGRQKSTAIQITIEDTQSSNFGEGYDISNISLLVGVKRGTNKIKAAASYG